MREQDRMKDDEGRGEKCVSIAFESEGSQGRDVSERNDALRWN